jgi:hypothetical protein
MLGLVTMLIGLGCAPHHRPAETVEVERFDIHIEAHFGALVDTESHRSIQAATDADLRLQVALTPVRLFRDGSLGSIVSIESASLRVSEGGADRSMPLTLVGRTAELRTFPNGEILDIAWGDRLAGLGRYLDVFEVVFPAISPGPPTVDDGEKARRRIIWPFRGAAGLRWDNAVEAVWSNQGVRKVGEEEAWQIHYEGPWTLRGPTRTNRSVTSYMAEGQGSGTVGLELSSGLLVSHDFEWQRTAVVSRKRSLQQTQTFVGHVERIR